MYVPSPAQTHTAPTTRMHMYSLIRCLTHVFHLHIALPVSMCKHILYTPRKYIRKFLPLCVLLAGITEARVFTIRIDPPLVQTTFYNKGGCLTRGEIIFDATIYLSPCQPLYLTDNYGREYFNQNTRYQQWRIEPFTVSGMSGVRIVGGTVAASGYCLQLEKDSQESPLLFRQDWVDKFLFQRCAADSKRQLFAVAVLD